MGMKHPTPPRASRPPLEGALADDANVPAAPAEFAPEIVALTHRLRAFIRTAIPTAEERVYKDGNSAGYHEPRCGAFCGLFPRRDAVYLAFPHGDGLPDDAGLLTGSGGRYAILRPNEEIPEAALEKLLLVAVLIGSDHHAP